MNPSICLSRLHWDRLGLYIHIPFCAKKCPYCDFNTYAGLDEYHQALVDALCREMAKQVEIVHGRQIDTIFLGGGTPTILSAPQLTQLFERIHDTFQIAPTAEITCEANPGTVDRDKFEILHTLGVNRLSIGVQSFQAEELAFLGRIHNTTDVIEAFEAARAAGFTNINLDFIFGLPEQSITAWQATLEQAIALAPEHLSLYSLIVEPNTPLFHWVQTGKVADTDDDLAADLYEAAMMRLADAGYIHYEVSNWARPRPLDKAMTKSAQPVACEHNLIYWRNQEYLGIGPGAHSHLRHTQLNGLITSQRWNNCKSVPGYIRRLEKDEVIGETVEDIPPRLAMGETMMLGLRLIEEGVPFDRFTAQHGAVLPTVFRQELADLEARGVITVDSANVRLTPRGLLVGNQVFAYFLPD